MTIHLHRGDLPPDLDFGDSVAVDTETMGLSPVRDRLCVVQLSAGDGDCHLVQFARDRYEAPNLKAVLADPAVIKIFHFARFDLAVIRRYLGIRCAPVYCTKVASKLARTFGAGHGLKDLCLDLLGIEISKQQQTSDWGAAELSPAQREYAAADVLYLHRLAEKLDELLTRENRQHLAAACFSFLPTRAELDLLGWADIEVFEH